MTLETLGSDKQKRLLNQNAYVVHGISGVIMNSKQTTAVTRMLGRLDANQGTPLVAWAGHTSLAQA
jgi:hypothetical protein